MSSDNQNPPNTNPDDINSSIDFGFYCSSSESYDSDESYYDPYLIKLDYENKIYTFRNKTKLSEFILSNGKFEEPYWIFTLKQSNSVIEIKMRDIESIVQYLIKFQNKL